MTTRRNTRLERWQRRQERAAWASILCFLAMTVCGGIAFVDALAATAW